MTRVALPQLMTALQGELLRHPHTALAYLTAWLDPLTVLDVAADPGSGESDDYLLYALEACRQCFPEVYAVTAQLVGAGATYRDVETYICSHLQSYLEVPPDSLEAFAYGVPFQPLGIEYGHEVVACYPALVPILKWLGMDPEAGCEGKSTLLERLITSLQSLESNETAQDVLHLLHWLYGSSGNTAVDYSEEAFWDSGIDSADWTPDNVAFMNEIHREARTFIDHALRGADTLRADATWRRAFRRNYKKLQGATDVSHIRLHWPVSAGDCPEQGTDPAA